ncbi:MAG: formylglycine-generating enzyme family protein, partial [Candidatus Riflebacteria bacterium]|nr:formylglycine-generating enzyme family protein [Candidatus Riflebacteria bacterium]
NEQVPNNEQINQPNQNTNNTDNTPITAGVKISVSVNGVKFPLMGCPKGEFIMNNKYKATIKEGFYIGKYEVTQGQYKAIMGNNPSIITGDKLPVHNINWLDAKKFCVKLNELTKDKRPAGYVFSLPSEKQWEYACRSGYTTSLNNGKNLTNLTTSDNELNKLGWYEANSCEKIQTVGKKIANAWGIHDMLGNAWEFCGDNIPYEGNKYANHRLVRGGGYKSNSQECSCSSRKIIKESSTDEELGFRIILKPID